MKQAYADRKSVCIKKIPWLFSGISAQSQRRKPILDRLPSLQDSHAEVVHEFHADSAEGSYLLCERIEGDSLADILERERRLPLEVVRAITRQTASALTAAHDLGLTHGNLSPGAIVIQRPAADAELWVKVRDFGLGKPLGPELFGALGYLAPEQVDPKEPRPEPTPLSDQFALAVIAFEMLAGRRAFPGDSLDEIAPKLRGDPVHFQIQGVSKKESQRIISGLHKAMSRLPNERFASLSDFVAALEARTQNPRSRASVIEASRFAPEHQPPLQLGSSVAQALVVASKQLPGPLDLVRPGQDAQTLTLVRSMSTHAAHAATLPMISRLALQVNVQTTIANQSSSRVNVVLPPSVVPTPAAPLGLKPRRVLFGLCLGVLVTTGLCWGFSKRKGDEAQSSRAISESASAAGESGSALAATPPVNHSPGEPPGHAVAADPQARKLRPDRTSANRTKRRKFALSCLPDSKLARALSQHMSECSVHLEEKSRGAALVIPYVVSPDGHPTFDSNPPPRGPASVLRCLRDFVTGARKTEFGTLPKLGGVLSCTIN